MKKRRFGFQSDSSDDDDARPMTEEEKRQYELKIRARKAGRYHEDKRQAEPPPAAARLDGFSDDIIARFASYLTAAEMVGLQLTCRAFGLAADGGGRERGRGRGPPAAPDRADVRVREEGVHEARGRVVC